MLQYNYEICYVKYVWTCVTDGGMCDMRVVICESMRTCELCAVN